MSEGACTIEAMNDIAATLAEVGTALGEVVGSALADGSSRMWRDDEVLELMSAAAQIARHAEAVLIEAASQVDDRSAAPALSERMTNRFGCRSVSELVQRATRVSGRRASELIKAGRAVRQEVGPTSGELLPPEFPAMREALVEGAVGLDALLGATAPIAGLATAAGRAAHLAADEELAAAARGADGPAATADELRSFATVWSMYLDPDGAEPREAKAMRKRGITLGRCQDGIVPIRGGLLPDVAAQLDLLANAVLNPRVDDITRGPHFTEDPDEPASDPDTRTGAQKLHDVFATVLTKAAASGQFPTIGGAAPTLVVSARAEDLASGRGFAHIDAPADSEQADRHFGGRCSPLLVAPRTQVLDRAARLEMRGPHLEERVVLLSPAEPGEVEQHARLLELLRLVVPSQSPARIGPVEQQAIDALGMPRRVFDRDRSAPACRHKRKPAEAGGIDNLFEILDPGFERQVLDVTVGKSAAARIVAEQRMIAGQRFEPRPPGKAAPLVLEMGEPGRRHHQRQPLAGDGVGELHTV